MPPTRPRSRGTATYCKPPLDHQELVDRLRSRGLNVPDEERARRYLRHLGYYRLSPYVIPFRHAPGMDAIRPGTTFDDVLELYVFDRHLRLLVLDGLERIEVAVRAALTDHMSTATGNPHWYLDDGHFKSRETHRRLLAILEQKVEQQLSAPAEPSGDNYSYPSALEHYVTHYGVPSLPPSWIMVEQLTIGELNAVVSNLARRNDRTVIAATLGINEPLLQSWLRTYVRVRNICAHHGRLWNTGLGVYPAIPESRRVPWLDDSSVLTDPHSYRRRRLYPVLISIKSVLRTVSPRSQWGMRLVQLLDDHPTIPLHALGMTRGWYTDPFWQ